MYSFVCVTVMELLHEIALLRGSHLVPVFSCNFNTTQHLCITSPLLRPHNIFLLAQLLIH